MCNISDLFIWSSSNTVRHWHVIVEFSTEWEGCWDVKPLLSQIQLMYRVSLPVLALAIILICCCCWAPHVVIAIIVPLQRREDFGIGLMHLSIDSLEMACRNFFLLYISIRYVLTMMHVFSKFYIFIIIWYNRCIRQFIRHNFPYPWTWLSLLCCGQHQTLYWYNAYPIVKQVCR